MNCFYGIRLDLSLYGKYDSDELCLQACSLQAVVAAEWSLAVCILDIFIVFLGNLLSLETVLYVE